MTTVKIQIWDDNNQPVAAKEFKDAENYTEKTTIIKFLLREYQMKANIPPELEAQFQAATTANDLKCVIADIMDEYDFGILAELKARVEKLEDD